MKCLYLVVRSLDAKGTRRERWKPARNDFAITSKAASSRTETTACQTRLHQPPDRP
jgi:hypothetical protein